MIHNITTVFRVGHLKPAPGTWGSLAALPMAIALHYIGGFWLLLAATIAVFGIGLWAVMQELLDGVEDDPSEIVIDEVVGQWIALWPVSYGAVFAGADILALWPGILTAFLAFRLFDIWKPGPVRWADSNEGAMAVMLDDVVAGLMAAGVVVALAAIAHLWLI